MQGSLLLFPVGGSSCFEKVFYGNEEWDEEADSTTEDNKRLLIDPNIGDWFNAVVWKDKIKVVNCNGEKKDADDEYNWHEYNAVSCKPVGIKKDLP